MTEPVNPSNVPPPGPPFATLEEAVAYAKRITPMGKVIWYEKEGEPESLKCLTMGERS